MEIFCVSSYLMFLLSFLTDFSGFLWNNNINNNHHSTNCTNHSSSSNPVIKRSRTSFASSFSVCCFFSRSCCVEYELNSCPVCIVVARHPGIPEHSVSGSSQRHSGCGNPGEVWKRTRPHSIWTGFRAGHCNHVTANHCFHCTYHRYNSNYSNNNNNNKFVFALVPELTAQLTYKYAILGLC